MATNLDNQLRITEIFCSLQGESSTVGLPTTFIRLTGCPLRCVYCDTAYAFSGGKMMEIDEIMAQVRSHHARCVTVTGGEPLAQPNSLKLLDRLAEEGYLVSLETSGAIDVSGVNSKVVKVMDLKTPSSGELAKNRYENINHLNRHDEVKFVIGDRADYEWAKFKIDEFDLYSRVAEILFSPVHRQLSATDLAEWILQDRLKVRMQIQLHKLLWNDEPGH